MMPSQPSSRFRRWSYSSSSKDPVGPAASPESSSSPSITAERQTTPFTAPEISKNSSLRTSGEPATSPTFIQGTTKSQENSLLLPTLNPSTAPVLVLFSPFSLRILTTSPQLLLETETFFSLTKSYLENLYRSATDIGPSFRALRLSGACSISDTGLACTFRDGAALFDPRGDVLPPPPDILDWIHAAAFAEDQIDDYLAYLRGRGGGALGELEGAILEGGAASEKAAEAPTAVAEGAFSATLGVCAVSGCLFLCMGCGLFLRGRRRKEKKKKSSVVVTASYDTMDDVSSITTMSHRSN
mmetsp:Transcript_7567/g.16396  ORF Transcript_7567/g.16396 Transcript_7567/m.16396 type:complete len:299 (-) Transcript_7567:145-1041(-)